MRVPRLYARLRAGSIALALSVLICAPARAQQTTVFLSTLSIAEQSIDAHGHTFVLLQVAGDLPRVLVAALSIGAEGALAGGDSALNVSRLAPQYLDKRIDPTLEDRQGDPQ